MTKGVRSMWYALYRGEVPKVHSVMVASEVILRSRGLLLMWRAVMT